MRESVENVSIGERERTKERTKDMRERAKSEFSFYLISKMIEWRGNRGREKFDFGGRERENERWNNRAR